MGAWSLSHSTARESPSSSFHLLWGLGRSWYPGLGARFQQCMMHLPPGCHEGPGRAAPLKGLKQLSKLSTQSGPAQQWPVAGLPLWLQASRELSVAPRASGPCLRLCPEREAEPYHPAPRLPRAGRSQSPPQRRQVGVSFRE